MTDAHAYVDQTGAADRLVIGEGRTMDDLRELGAWMSMRDPADLGAWR